MDDRTCFGCKFLCRQDCGYSNWTVTDTDVLCLLDMNPNLPKSEPWDWTTGGGDNWEATNNSRCMRFSAGEHPHFDVDGETTADDFKADPELHAALIAAGYTGATP